MSPERNHIYYIKEDCKFTSTNSKNCWSIWVHLKKITIHLWWWSLGTFECAP